jgi:hypothetical protein
VFDSPRFTTGLVRYPFLVHDRDAKVTAAFGAVFVAAGVGA